MDIREFCFRHMHSADEPKDPMKKLRQAEIKNDPVCRDMCARFLFTEIWAEGREVLLKYEANVWEPLAEFFINNIVPSDDFMHECIVFFADIREGKLAKYDTP